MNPPRKGEEGGGTGVAAPPKLPPDTERVCTGSTEYRDRFNYKSDALFASPFGSRRSILSLLNRLRIPYTLLERAAIMSKTSRDFIKLWLPVIVWLCFISFMSTGTFSAENTFSVVRAVLESLFPRLGPDHVAALHVIIRKAAHVFEYFTLGLLLLRAFRAGSLGAWKWRWPFLATICLILWSLGDEFHQSFVPTRTASMTDVVIDTAGGVLAQFAGAFWHRYLRRRSTPRLCSL